MSGVLNEIGVIQNVIVNTATGHMIDGHLRAQMAISQNQPTVPITYVELTEEEEKLALATFDPLSAMAGTDKELLASLTADLPDAYKALQAATSGELLTGHKEAPEAEMDRAEELLAIWKVERGQIWEIGRHRLMCGDSTARADVEALMQGEKAGLVFTDPPYGIGEEIANDDLKGIEFDSFNESWISILPCGTNSAMICYHSTRTFPSALNAALSASWKFERMLWYYRPDKFPTHSWNNWMMVSQAIMLLALGAPKYLPTESDQDCYRHTSSDLGTAHNHPTEKMSGHTCRVMSHFDAAIIFDGFLGSGTTMVAAEQLSRRCYGLEIEPKYCAVILQRLAAMGLKPELAQNAVPA